MPEHNELSGEQLHVPGAHTHVPTEVAGGIQVATTHISSAQLLDLHNAPVELLPAAASGTGYVLLWAIGKVNHGTTDYAGPVTLTLGYVWNGDVSQATNDDFRPPLTSAILGDVAWIPGALNDCEPLAYIGSPLAVKAATALTDGDGTLDVTLVYVVV